MLKKPENHPEVLVSCKVCLKEIPRSVASSHEATEYVLYFCGDDCFVEWQKDVSKSGKPDTKAGK